MAASYSLLPRAEVVHTTSSDSIPGQSDRDANFSKNADVEVEMSEKQEAGSKLEQKWNTFIAIIADGWTLEWASLGCSALLLVGLIVLFRVFDKKPITAWSASLSFTTVIAIISKAIQTTLMLPVAASISQLGWVHFYRPRALIDFQKFDAASRGLLGTVRLVFALPSVWTVITTILAVVALGIEAAAQQCLGRTATSYLPVVKDMLTLDSLATDGASINFGMVNADVLAMTQNKGLTQTERLIPPSSRASTVLPQTLVYNCASSDCSRPSPYLTLGFCSKCEDVSESLVVQDWCVYDDQASCGIYVPGGPALHFQEQASALNATLVSDSDSPQPGPLILANFTMVEQVFPFTTTSGHFDQPLHFAAQACTITLCANIYQLNISQGDTGSSGAVEILLASFDQAASNVDDSFTITVPQDAPMKTVDGKATHWRGDTQNLWIDANSTAFLREYLASLFTGTSSPDIGYYPTPDRRLQLAATVAQNPAGIAFWDRLVYILWGYQFRSSEDYFSQVDSVLSAVTTSIGNWLRDFCSTVHYFDGSTSNDLGPTAKHYRVASSYHIDWKWLIVPVVAEFLALVSMATAVRLTKAYKVPIWKSSAMAVMTHGITRSEEAHKPSFQKVSAMEAAANRRETILGSVAVETRLIDVRDGSVEVKRWKESKEGPKQGEADTRTIYEMPFWF